jgi:ferritin-like metal-binding protein YciE
MPPEIATSGPGTLFGSLHAGQNAPYSEQRAQERLGNPVNQETLKELFVEQIRDLYDAEKQITKALPKLAKAAENEELAEALREHLEQTEGHVSRLEQVFEIAGEKAKGKPCKGMKGLLEEGSEAVKEEDKGPMRDLAIIAGCQKVEHYEISAYGTIRTLAEHLGMKKAIDLLQQTENEETEADEKLTGIATDMYTSEFGAEEEQEEEEEPEAMGAGTSIRAAGEARSRSKRKAS